MPISLFNRYAALAGCIAVALGSLLLLPLWSWLWPLALLAGILALIGLYDLVQTQHAVLRNYPILGHLRYLVEGIRPEIRQYLLESDDDRLPFSRSQRSLI